MSKLRRLSFFVIACAIAFHAAAQDAKKLAADALAEYNAKHFATSADLFRAAIATGGASPSDYYNGSCAMALAGLKDEAFATLREAARRGYANADQLLRDADLVSLRSDARWAPLLDVVKANSAAMVKKWDPPLMATPYRENLSDEEKLAGLSRVWSEVRYNFANFDLIPDVDWDALYLAAIPRVISTKSTFDYYKVLIALVAKLRDGHTDAWQPSELALKAAAMPPMRQEMIDGHVVIIKTGDAVKDLVHLGDEIVTVDGQPWKDYAAANVTPYLSASTPQDLDPRTAARLLTGAAGTTVTLGIRRADGTTSAVQLERQPPKERIRLITSSFEMRMLPNNIAY